MVDFVQTFKEKSYWKGRLQSESKRTIFFRFIRIKKFEIKV